jgi:hypothetical protein
MQQEEFWVCPDIHCKATNIKLAPGQQGRFHCQGCNKMTATFNQPKEKSLREGGARSSKLTVEHQRFKWPSDKSRDLAHAVTLSDPKGLQRTDGWDEVEGIVSRIEKIEHDENPENKKRSKLWASYTSSVHGLEQQEGLNEGDYLIAYLHRKSAKALMKELQFFPKGYAMRPITPGVSGKLDRPMQLFLSRKCTQSSCHWDDTPSLLVVVNGSKEVWIAPADVMQKMRNKAAEFGELQEEGLVLLNFDPFKVWREDDSVKASSGSGTADSSNNAHSTVRGLMEEIGWRHIALFAGGENADSESTTSSTLILVHSY